jgi:hypothetical protein
VRVPELPPVSFVEFVAVFIRAPPTRRASR